jgi:hypothetical protein
LVTWAAILIAGGAMTAKAQDAAPPVVPKGSWGLLTAAKPYPRVWGVYPSSQACIAGQKQLHLQAMARLSSMRGVTPDEFSDAVNNLNALDAANCVKS